MACRARWLRRGRRGAGPAVSARPLAPRQRGHGGRLDRNGKTARAAAGAGRRLAVPHRRGRGVARVHRPARAHRGPAVLVASRHRPGLARARRGAMGCAPGMSSRADRRSPCRRRGCSTRGRARSAPSSSRSSARCSSRSGSRKRDILGIWLTLAPYGGNLEGVRAGAEAWFGVPPAVLDRAQSALLVAIPRRPEALRPDRHAARARRLRDRILASAAAAPMPGRRIAVPAPRRAGGRGAAARAHRRHHARPAAAGGGRAHGGGPARDAAAARLARPAGRRSPHARNPRPLCRGVGQRGAGRGARPHARGCARRARRSSRRSTRSPSRRGSPRPTRRSPTCRAISAATRRRISTAPMPAASPPPRRCAARSTCPRSR